MPEGARELRLVVTVPDHDKALHFYRDVLCLREEAAFTDANGGRATLLRAGRATVELGDEAHAEAIDVLEVGRRVAPSMRLAFEVEDARTVAAALAEAGAQMVAQPVSTPWGSLNARLDSPDGQQLTVYSKDVHLSDARIDSQIVLAEPDPTWATTGSALVDEVRDGNSWALVVAHVGSTAIPGLRAKPIIDLVLGVRDPSDEGSYIPALEALGYHLHIREPEWQEHRLLRHFDPAVNLHVFAAGADEIERMLAFRDHLRRDKADRDFYLRTKLELASRTWARVQDYADAKSEVVEDILRRATSCPPQTVRGCLILVTGTAGGSDLARVLSTGTGLPLLDSPTVEAALNGAAGPPGPGLSSAARAVVLALAGQSGGAVLAAEWPIDTSALTALPLPVVEIACGHEPLADGWPVFEHIEQADVDVLLPALRQAVRTR